MWYIKKKQNDIDHGKTYKWVIDSETKKKKSIVSQK